MKKFLTFLFFAVIGLRLCGQNSPAPVRWAIVSESTDTVAAADLLTAQFSKRSGAIVGADGNRKSHPGAAIVVEQSGPLEAGAFAGRGWITGVTVRGRGHESFLNVQLVAVKPGVLLADERFNRPAQDTSAWSANIVNRLEPLLPKLGVSPEDAIPLSVVNFHAGVRTAAAAGLEQQIFFLTVERLVREKRLFVLERKRLHALSEKKCPARRRSRFGMASICWTGRLTATVSIPMW